MKISQDFVNNLWFKGGWQLETVNEQTFTTLSNPVLCRLFWMQYWLEVLLPAFQNQTHIKVLHDLDITTKVIIDTVNGKLLSAPPSWVNIFYYGNYFKDIKEPLFLVQNSTFAITIFIIFIIVALNLVVLFISDKNQKLVEFI
jgi:hypothetical protein